MLIFGWGSCSGCDALQACRNIKEVDELRNQLYNEIIWKDSKEEMRDFIENRDWKLQYSYRRDETKQFIKEALDILS